MVATATRDQRATFGLRLGDVVLTKDSETADDIGVSALVAEDVPDLVCGYHLAVVRPRTGHAVGRYLRWALASMLARQRMSAAATGVTRFGLRSEAIADLRVPVPSLAGQHAIADYLDRETERIDALILAKRTMLELLDERWQSAMETVASGTSTGEATQLRHLLAARISDGPHETPEFASDGVPFLSVDNVTNRGLDFDSCRYITHAAHARYSKKAAPQRGDVLITKAASVGKVALVETTRDFNIWSPIAILRARAEMLSPAYLSLVLRSASVQAQIKNLSTHNTQSNVSMQDLGSIRIPVPPLPRQLEIVDSMDRADLSRRSIEDALAAQATSLAERRQALITAAVTGQFDIRAAA